MTSIRWDFVAQAVAFYEAHGYRYVEVPWIVSPEAVCATLPPGRVAHTTVGGTLVGSAEQSFIHMACAGSLKPGDYVAASPCFRDDPPDELHQQTFFKVELISLGDSPLGLTLAPVMTRAVLQHALTFFRSLPGGAAAKEVETDAGWDIELNGIEVGSYGARSHGGWHWVYGTGLAEPRFSIASRAV